MSGHAGERSIPGACHPHPTLPRKGGGFPFSLRGRKSDTLPPWGEGRVGGQGRTATPHWNRPAHRNPQLRRPRPRPRPALGALLARRLADRPRPHPLRRHPRRPRLGRAPAPRPDPARARPRRARLPRRPRRDRHLDPSRPDDLKARLRPHREAILPGVYRRVVADCRERGVPVVWVLLPRVGKPVDPEDRAEIVELAKAAGFDRTSTSATPSTAAPPPLAIAPDDFHPNAEGHAELARRIDAALAEFLSSSARSSRPLQ